MRRSPASFQPANPNAFTVLIAGAVPNHKTILDASNEKTEIPAEILLAGDVSGLTSLVAQLFRQPPRHVISEATGINKMLLRLGNVKCRALECDYCFDRGVH